MATYTENNLEHLCNIIEYVLAGKCRVMGGMYLGGVVVVTVNNGYRANNEEVEEISRTLNWANIMACPGAISASPHRGVGVAIEKQVARPYINPRLSIGAT